jgi:hypothetical protein
MRHRLIALALVSLTLIVSQASARDREIHVDFDRQKIRNYNIVLTPLFSLASAVVQGRVHSWRDAGYQLAVGTAAGASYYQAKRLIGTGHATEGWLLTNATASAIENATSGERLLGRFGYTVGPVRFRIATPLARQATARIEMDSSLAETASFVKALSQSDRFSLRNGIIATDRDTCWPDPDIKGHSFCGRTYGVFPGVAPFPSTAHEDRSTLWHHEMIHAVQSQQMDSVEPPVHTFGGEPRASGQLRLFAVRNVRLGYTHILDLPTYNRPYQERWLEVEAYALAERTPVLP